MRDLYFNELSVDYNVSNQPTTEEDAKGLLLQLIETFFAYKICTGEKSVAILSKEEAIIKNISNHFGMHKFYEYLAEFEMSSLITDEQKKVFKASVSETFCSNWNPEFYIYEKNCSGLGESTKDNVYSISYATEKLVDGFSWDSHEIELTERKIDENGFIPPDIIVNSKNLSSTKHVVINYEIWQGCNFLNKKPTIEVLPKKAESEFIVKSFTSLNWSEFYTQQHTFEPSLKKRIGRAVARINGWVECRSTDDRATFSAKNRYLAVDTRHSTFEVYIGIENHQGEMKFHDESIDFSKADPTRKVTVV